MALHCAWTRSSENRGSVGVYAVVGRIGLCSIPVNTDGLGLNTASEANGGQFDDGEYSTRAMYSRSDQDSRDNKDIAGGDRRGVRKYSA